MTAPSELDAPGRRRLLAATLLPAGMVAGALAIGWIEREPIVRHFVDRRLAGAGVSAAYRLTRLGPLAQRLEQVRIGDPAHPDLIAERIDLTLRYGLHGPYLHAVRAAGVRLAARVVDGRLSLGAIDRLLPRSAPGAAIVLPDLEVATKDARIALATPAGPIALTVDGSGNLARAFDGRVRAAAPRLAAGGCAMTLATADVALHVRDRRPNFAGPVGMAGLACPARALTLSRGQATLDLALEPSLTKGRGAARVEGFAGRAAGVRFGPADGAVTVAGDTNRFGGAIDIGLVDIAAATGTARRGSVTGAYRYAPEALGFDGKISLRAAAATPALRRQVQAAPGALSSTPLGPVATQAAQAVARFLAEADADIALAVTLGPDSATAIRIAAATIAGRDGGFVRVRDGGGLGWSAGGGRLESRVTTGGGGLPVLDIAVHQPSAGAPIAGLVTLAPYRAGDAMLALSPVRFTVAAGRARFATIATIDGPLGTGRIGGLTVPIAGVANRGGAITLLAGCTPVGLRRLAIAGFTLDPARLVVCGDGGGPVFARSASGAVRIAAGTSDVQLTGRSGSSPLTMRAAILRVSDRGVAARDVAIRLGGDANPTRLDVAALDGSFDTQGISGGFTGAGGRIGAVPLVLTDAAGRWRLAGGVLDLHGDLRVADSAPAPRFLPMAVRDVALRLVDGRVTASGAVHEPATGARIADVTLRHDLASGAGHADIAVPGLVFAVKRLQPEMLTPLTLGVVANVKGMVAGEGAIDWGANGVTSTGRFHTDGLDLAAAFGPVTGIAGTILFSDLLGLATPPHQQATIATVNPGIVVADGIARYQLLPGNRARIEDARWPFAGGTLTLEPTILDFGQAAERHLTFRLDGVDAAAFVQQLDFPNISATATFDGALPMIFDQSGGRIERGALAARGGGTLAYVGELSNAELGTMGTLAFDALKAIRYKALTISLDGALDGEIVSEVRFEGVRQATGERTLIARLIRDLPFRFNIRIRAPFRSLVGSARAFADPSLLLDAAHLHPIQPVDSGAVR